KQAQVELIGAFPEVWVSRSGLGQALCHLLDNSLKFMAPGVKPRIQFQSEERGRFLRLKIQDNGIGVEAAYHERIFQPFERLQGDAYEGTGIGLAIVQEAVHRMGGKAGVDSELGKGSCFWMDLPRVSDAAEENIPARELEAQVHSA
ncbi:MAG TPA: ATP-binding protein, partial [Verrucomicrobiae bacterium]|nr:ATP-binding protein [Verrucomicrobiae bacterium]